MFSKERNGTAQESKKPIEMEQLKNKKADDQPEGKNDVVIGRFRKVSSAKSMANTNGGARYPVEFPAEGEDPETGLVFGDDDGPHFGPHSDTDNFTRVDEKPVKIAPTSGRPVITKSSFRNTEKPSRFKNHPSTRFQVCIFNNSFVTLKFICMYIFSGVVVFCRFQKKIMT